MIYVIASTDSAAEALATALWLAPDNWVRVDTPNRMYQHEGNVAIKCQCSALEQTVAHVLAARDVTVLRIRMPCCPQPGDQ